MWHSVKNWVSPDRSQVAAAALISQDHSTRATPALQKLVETDPAFGSLALWCTHRDATPQEVAFFLQSSQEGVREIRLSVDVAPAYTDGKCIWYGQDFEGWSLDEQVGVCAHEIMHVACRHVQRGKALAQRLGYRYDPAIFNIATDAIINETLRLAGHTLPAEGVDLRRLLQEVLKEPGGKAPQVLVEWDAETLYGRLIDARDNDQSAHDALQIIGQGVYGDLHANGEQSLGDALEDAEWAVRLDRALSAGAAAGRGIGLHARNLADLPKSKTPWEIILRRLVTKAVSHRPQHSFARPARRWLAMDCAAQLEGRRAPALEPGLIKSEDQPRVAVCLDVSGSISQGLLQRFGGEIEGIARRTGSELHLIVFDDGIQLDRTLESFDLTSELESLSFNGGGGTSFAEPIGAAMEQDPSVILVMTDLCGPFGQEPKCPVIWASSNLTAAKPPFGQMVLLEN